MMTIKPITYMLTLLLLASVSSPVSAAENRRIAVMPIEDSTGTFDDGQLDNAADYLRTELVETHEFIIIRKKRQNKKLHELVKDKQQESYRRCDHKACQIPLGKALAADTILRTRLIKLGDSCTFNATLIDISKEAAVAGHQTTFGCSSSGLRTAIASTVSDFTEKHQSPQSGPDHPLEETSGKDWMPGTLDKVFVQFLSQPPATVSSNGQTLCEKTPCSRLLPRGPNKVTFEAKYHAPQSRRLWLTQKRRVYTNLRPTTGQLRLNTSRDPQPVSLDGNTIGQTPLQHHIQPGTYQLKVGGGCTNRVSRQIDIKRGKTTKLRLSPKPKRVEMTINTQNFLGEHIEAALYQNDRRLGDKPGTYQISRCAEKITATYGRLSGSTRFDDLTEDVPKTVRIELKPQNLPRISAGPNVTCTVTEAYRLDCWGDMFSEGFLARTPNDARYIDISLNATRACALTGRHRVYCWDSHGATYTPDGRFKRIHATSSASFHCGISAANGIKCWDSYETFFEHPEGNYGAVRAMDERICTITKQGRAQCYGNTDSSGSLGDWHKSQELFLFDALPRGRYVDATTNTVNEIYGLKASGRIVSTDPDAFVPEGEFTELSRGLAGTCALRRDGTAVCWNGTPTFGFETTKYGPFRQIDVGNSQFCGVREDNSIDCWATR